MSDDDIDSEFDQRLYENFNPDDLSEWLKYQPLDFIQLMILEIRQQKISIDGYCEFLNYAPPDQMISLPWGEIPIGKCLSVIKKSAKNIDRLLDTLRAYRRALDEKDRNRTMKIVISDDYQQAVHTLEAFHKLKGHEVTIYGDTPTDIDTLAARFQGAEALVLIRERTSITADLLTRLPNLKFISQTGRTVPHIDLAACTQRGIPVAAGSGSPYAPAELTWALVMAATRNLPQEIASMKAGQWQTTLGWGLHGRTLGILGYGKIGALVANYGRAFGMRVIAYGREGSQSRAHADGIETVNSQRELFAQSDVLSVHLKLVDDTRGIVTQDDLRAMKTTALFVNTSRAELVAEGALVAALQTGRPGFAAVDVYEDEPVIDHPLLHMKNVICTPHLGYVEKDSYELYFGTAFDQLLAFFAGSPINILNPEALKGQ